MTVPKEYKLTLNLNEAIEDFNSDLTAEQVEMIARADFGIETEHESVDHEMHR